MEIPQEIIDSGICTAYLNTDPELIMSIEKYNEKMEMGHKLRRSLKRLERVFLMLNIAMPIIIGIIGLKAGGMFVINPRVIWLENAAAIVFLAAFFVFGLWRRNIIAVTAFSVLMLFADARCALMIGVNIVLTVFHEKNLRFLKKQQGYPSFLRIHIEKNNFKEPKNHEKSVDKAE